MKRGIDVSAFQDYIDWSQVAGSGMVDFVYSKATEGTHYVSQDFHSQHDGAKAQRLPVGCYHFFRFGQDGTTQAEAFLQATDGRLGDLLPMVDVEVTDGQNDLQAMIACLAAFNERVEKEVGRPILIYTDPGFWDASMGGTDSFAGHPLWVAHFGREPGKPDLPSGWSSWAIHQYTSGGVVPGIRGFVDLDVTAVDDLSAIVR